MRKTDTLQSNYTAGIVQHTSTALHQKSVYTFSFTSIVGRYCWKYKQLGVQRIWKCCILEEDRSECALIKGKMNLNCRSQTKMLKPALNSGREADIQNWVKMIVIVLLSEPRRWKCNYWSFSLTQKDHNIHWIYFKIKLCREYLHWRRYLAAEELWKAIM